MKKVFKKSVACFIAVLMIVSSLPFAAVTANAATSATINVTHYGVICNDNGTRFADPVLKICNDNENNNFTIGFINFDISGLNFALSDTVSCNYTYGLAFASNCKDPSTQAVSVFYPTKNTSDFSVSENKQFDKSGTTIYTSSTGTHVDRAKDYYGLTSLNADVEYANIDGNDKTVNIGPAIKVAKDAGRTEATVCFMFKSAGKTAQDGGWSDTDLTVKNKSNISVTISEATDYVIPSNLSADTANTTPKTFTASSYFGTAVVPGYQGNVIYCSKSVALDEDTDNYLGKKMCVPKNTVMAYNGATDTYMPVFAGFYATTDKNVQMCYVTLNWSSNPFSIDSWTGYINKSLDNTAGVLKDSPSELSVTKSETLLNYQSHDANRVSFVKNDHGNGDYYWWTKMKYTGTGNSDTYYDKYTNPVFQFGHRNEYWGWKNRTVNKTVSNTNVYVVNYKPIYDVLSNSRKVNSLGGNYTFKELYNKVWGNNKYYTVSSLNKYYDAVSKLIAVDPQSYLADATDSNVESKVIELSSKIKTAYDNYISAAQGLVARPVFYFQRADGSQIAEIPADNESTAYFWGITSKNVSTTPDTEKTSNGNGQHTWKTYSWPTSATNNVFKEIETDHIENCSGGTATCTTKAVCSVCNAEYGEALGHNYTYEYVDETYHTKKCTRGDLEEKEEHTLGTDGKCTVCGGKLIDYTAYEAAAKAATTLYTTGSSEYTSDSLNEYWAIVSGARAKKDDAKNQAELDALTDTIISAQTVLRKNSVTVTLEINYVNSVETKTYENQAYGSELEIDLADVAPSIKGVEKWTVSTDNGSTTTKLSTTDTKLTLLVTKSATVTVFELDEPDDSETVEYSKVVFLGKNSVVVAIQYVAKDGTLPTSGIKAPEIPFYTFSGWSEDEVKGTGDTIYVRAEYTYSDKEEDMCNVHFGNWSKAYSYDSFVHPEGIDPSKQYALASDAEGKNILTYLEGVEFYAPKTSDIYVVEVSERVAKTGITGHFAQALPDIQKRSAVYNCKFYLPEDCTAIEWGLEVTYGTKTQIIRAENLSKGNEYTVIVRVKETSSITNVSCRSYVTYKQGNETKTIYSDAVEQDF
ncbi:MAG: hypothetical protein Q4C99_01955 [Clostridia bacterium]|nr:hypothetical protein [Clostridia bacterium]